MRILVVFHGWFPEEGRPVSGGGLRAWHHVEALGAAGHEVVLLTRAQDAVPGGPAGFDSPGTLRAAARALAPDAVVCVQMEDAPALADLGIPLAVDLYAPRLLEALWEGRAEEAAVRTLGALGVADLALFSNDRQRSFHLGLLVLAGADPREVPARTVPLVAPRGPAWRPPGEPLFVLGGIAWPWCDPLEGVVRAAAHLERRGRGRVLVLGGRPVVGSVPGGTVAERLGALPRVTFGDLVPYRRLLETYAGATAALDYLDPSPERELAVSFRHMDYLGCGLPILTGGGNALAGILARSGAGIVGEPVEQALDLVLADPDAHARRSAAARELAEGRFSRETCEAPLLAWLEDVARGRWVCRRPTGSGRRASLLGDLAAALHRATEAEVGMAEARVRLAAMEAEVVAKREENAALVLQVRQLGDSLHRLTGALAEVAGFKREAIAVLGTAEDLARREATDLGREVAIARADIAKKSAELLAMEAEQRRLENDLVHAREEIERLRRRRFLP